jgi:glycosyltransferase 2 family protein
MNQRRRVMTMLGVAVVAAFALAFAIGNGASARSLASGVGSIDVTVALVGLGCSALAMGNRGLLNRAAHRAVGLDAGVGAMTHTAAVGFAAQKMIKSAGAVGLVVFLRHGKRRGHAPCAVAAACLLTASASFVAMGVLLGAALVVLAVTGQLTGWWLAAGVAFAVYVLILAPIAVLIVRNRRAAHWAWRGGQRIRRRLPWCKNRDASDAQFPTALLDAVADARTRPRAMRDLLLHAVVSKVLGALALAAAIMAVGLPITAAGALVIYATALAASLLTIVPGGIGTVEASTTAMLIGAGATAGAAALAVALFRLFDLWLPVLTGAAVARRDARRDRRCSETEVAGSYTIDLARLEHWAAASAHL